MNWLSRLGINQRLAAFAFVLGVVALLAHPQRGLTRVDAQGLAAGLPGSTIGPLALAEWIIRGSSDYRLVDVRDQAAFAAYHLPGAENLAISSLADGGLAHNEKIVICSDNGTSTAQAWFVLKAHGYTAVYLLDGGIEAWKRDVLFPVLKENPTPAEQTENERRRQISAHFGGTPMVGATPSAGQLALPAAMPKVEAPSLPAAGNKATAKKKKEGC